MCTCMVLFSFVVEICSIYTVLSTSFALSVKGLNSLHRIVCRCRGRKVLENRSVTDEERIVQLQRELEAAVLLGEETDRKFEEV